MVPVEHARDRRVAAANLVAIAIAAIVVSRIVLRSERDLALPAGALPYVVAGVIAAIAVRWLIAGRLQALSAIELALTGCVVCVCVATLAMPQAPFWSYALLPYLVLGGSFVLARRFADCVTVRWMLALTGALVAAGVLLDAVGLAVFSPHRRPSGLLGNRNFAGEYIALALPAALVVFTRARRWLAILVLFGVALALTRCRTAWIAAAFALVALPLLSAVARRRLAVGAALVIAGVLLATVMPTRLAWRERHPFAATLERAVDLETGSGALRIRQFRATFEVLDARGAWWTGLGAGAWQAAVRAEDRAITRNRVPHSDYLRALSDGGVPALAALCLTLLAAGLAAWRLRRDHPELVVFVGVLALVGLADAALFRPEVIVVTGAVLAVLQPRGITCGLEPAAVVER